MSHPFDLSGKVSLVTGGAGGIGLGMAEALAAAGSAVALWDLRDDRLACAEDRLRGLGAEVSSCVVDVTCEADVVAAMQATLDRFSRVDTVIAAAGVLGEPTPFVDMSFAHWRRVQAVNLDGAFLTFREAARHMVSRAAQGDAGGSLIGIASLAAHEGAPQAEGYSASKGAILALMRSLAVELARHGVRANSIAPGWIATEMTEAMQQSEAVATKTIKRIPLRRWGSPQDLAGLAVYLASDASAYHTADSFIVDGGYAAF